MTRDIQTQIASAVQCDLVPLTHGQRHNNTHFRGDRDGSPHLFIKVTTSDRSYVSETGALMLLQSTGLPTPQLVAHGELAPSGHWLAFTWHDFHSFAPVPHAIEEAGRILGRLHATTAGATSPHLRRYGRVPELIEAKAALVAEFDEPLAARIRALRDAIMARTAAALGEHTCLLHGDMGWRNLHQDADNKLWIFDFEHAAIGHPLLDFAKLWDRELDAADARKAFLTGYGEEQRDIAVDLSAIDAVRLWAAAGVFPYARPRQDHDFERHAYLILDRLEWEDSVL
ncbi:aminoglycoside phosphotransferase family protein [Streptomyces sp. TRM66268-LWL]|uniref:Aminoglycoside phosphotransferase family protein n=1 Tax=Streptomyces polyasparticus TaxID=2767826 RepID=A0ABR7SR79_9ACTN|nr:aminoglycoside phosphotransferase family protein [Streptomyces polyasparticus]MBC9718006.1 aminoglycoside phosphotransferase family protein [Streptomyces polyasparticus]